jgi:hypothetical protein
MRTFVASEHGAKLDTDLRHGGGSDDTAALQTLLDRGRDEGGVHVVIDGPARVTGLDVYSNTTLEGTDGAGLYLADDSDRAIIRNAHRSRGEIVDERITIRGLVLWGNRDHQLLPWVGDPLPGEVGVGREPEGIVQLEQDRSWKSPLQLLGVRHLVVENVEIWDGRAFTLWLANVSHVEIRNVVIDVNLPPYPTGASVEDQLAFIRATPPNVDGIHINGPADHVLIDGARIHVWDDAIALDANDWGVADLTIDDLAGPYAGQGPITDVEIRNIHLDAPSHGIRILSADQRIDRVEIENVYGAVKMRTVNISHFAIPERGDIGSLAFRNIRLAGARAIVFRELHPEAYAAQPPGTFDEERDSAFFVVNAAVESLELTDVSLTDVAERPILLIGPDAKIGSLAADITVTGDETATPRTAISDGASVGHLSLDIRNAGRGR